MCDVPVNVLKCHVSGKFSHIDLQEFPEMSIKQTPQWPLTYEELLMLSVLVPVLLSVIV